MQRIKLTTPEGLEIQLTEKEAEKWLSDICEQFGMTFIGGIAHTPSCGTLGGIERSKTPFWKNQIIRNSEKWKALTPETIENLLLLNPERSDDCL